MNVIDFFIDLIVHFTNTFGLNNIIDLDDDTHFAANLNLTDSQNYLSIRALYRSSK